MLVIYHKDNCVIDIIRNTTEVISYNSNCSISETLIKIALKFPKDVIFWCHELYKPYLNITNFRTYFHHDKMMLSFNPSVGHYFPDSIGYVEQSPFINVNKAVCYPTWQMSSAVGAIHATVLNVLSLVVSPVISFDYFLNTLAKLAMPKGLFCYSEPKLLHGVEKKDAPKSSRIALYRFVKEHYKWQWLCFLFLNELVYEKKLAFVPFICAMFYKTKRTSRFNLDHLSVKSHLDTLETGTIDVIIPTIGRKQYLYDVLCDLKKQTHLPKNVIIVEQNPDKDSFSELDYLEESSWPFTIKHSFIHQSGACNARNLALNAVESDWVFFADDDIRFDTDLIKNACVKIHKYGIYALITSCLKPNQNLDYTISHQTSIFGSGFSFVKTSCLKAVAFDMGFEFGYGEDSDFGMQLRNKGYDVIYFPDLKIIHLKAPMGGFRTKPQLAWDNDKIVPSPSPTIILLKLKYDTNTQLKGYKLLLFLKLYFKVVLKTPLSFYKTFKARWDNSIVWAKKLKLDA